MVFASSSGLTPAQIVALERVRATLDELALDLMPASGALFAVTQAVPGTSRGVRALRDEVMEHLAVFDVLREQRMRIRESLYD